MGRLPYVRPGTSAEVDALYDQIAGLGRPIANLYRSLANQPAALEAFLGMSRYVRGGSSLDPQLRELAILATAYVFDQDYEIAHHVEAARKVGVPEDKLHALAANGGLEALSPEERCAVEFSRQVARTRTCDAATFARVEELLGREGATDLVVTAAWYHLCAVILDTAGVELEAEYGGPA